MPILMNRQIDKTSNAAYLDDQTETAVTGNLQKTGKTASSQSINSVQKCLHTDHLQMSLTW